MKAGRRKCNRRMLLRFKIFKILLRLFMQEASGRRWCSPAFYLYLLIYLRTSLTLKKRQDPRDHVAQYPLDVAQKKTMSNVLAIQVDAEGKTKYDAIA